MGEDNFPLKKQDGKREGFCSAVGQKAHKIEKNIIVVLIYA